MVRNQKNGRKKPINQDKKTLRPDEKKQNTSYYGYKNHINTGNLFKLIRKYTVTEASVHDSQVMGKLLDDENEGDKIWADSA